ncbi:MAG: rhomboid family intramembrane serine protease [Candidatus Eisenbacteria bacterium]|nr:rhomboid family intramembrane serine protease [Candidatus Eisenbacteria bacterium]
MEHDPSEPADLPADGRADDDEAAELAALGYVPPDPNEERPVDLWSAVGGVRPWGTLLLLLSWGVMFLLVGARGALADPRGLLAWGANATMLPWRENAWRLLASTFLHAGAAHVFFNSISLLVVGPAVERIFTRTRFWSVYALGGAVASFASLLWRDTRGGASLSVGGSGAIFALGGALLVATVRLRARLAPTRARALTAALLFLLAPGFAAGYAKPGTDNVAHAAGLACGALLGVLLPLDPRLGGRPPGTTTRVAAVVSLLALLTSLALGLAGGLTAR